MNFVSLKIKKLILNLTSLTTLESFASKVHHSEFKDVIEVQTCSLKALHTNMAFIIEEENSFLSSSSDGLLMWVKS